MPKLDVKLLPKLSVVILAFGTRYEPENSRIDSKILTLTATPLCTCAIYSYSAYKELLETVDHVKK